MYRAEPGRERTVQKDRALRFHGLHPTAALPSGGLVRGRQGNLYGNTSYGGDIDCELPNGCGVAFEVSSTGDETVLYSFTGGSDGANPHEGVFRDARGTLYGTTSEGGGQGVTVQVAELYSSSLTNRATRTVLYSFAGANGEPDTPNGVIEDSKGNLYGTTFYGGDLSCGQNGYGCGVVFKLTP